jgi:hypothetical protein
LLSPTQEEEKDEKDDEEEEHKKIVVKVVKVRVCADPGKLQAPSW